MDPLTALSVSGTIIQFIDFSSKIFVTSRQFYKSAAGSSSVNDELELATKDLSKILAKLNRPLGSTAPATDDEKALEELCDACSAVANELITRLDGLKTQGQPQVWKSFAAAIKSAWAEKEIEATKRRLAAFRESLEMRILVDLRHSINQTALQGSTQFNNFDEATKLIIAALLDNHDASARDLQDQTIGIAQMLNRNEVVIMDEHDKTRTMIINAIQQARIPSYNETSNGARNVPWQHQFANYDETERNLVASVKQVSWKV